MTSTARCSIRLAFASFASLALAAAAHAAPPAEAAAAAAESPPMSLPAAIGLLVIGPAILVALIVFIAARSIRASAGRLARNDRARRRPDEASIDAWREAGRRHPVPPRASDPTDDGGPGDRFG